MWIYSVQSMCLYELLFLPLCCNIAKALFVFSTMDSMQLSIVLMFFHSSSFLLLDIWFRFRLDAMLEVGARWSLLVMLLERPSLAEDSLLSSKFVDIPSDWTPPWNPIWYGWGYSNRWEWVCNGNSNGDGFTKSPDGCGLFGGGW